MAYTLFAQGEMLPMPAVQAVWVDAPSWRGWIPKSVFLK
jgi:hypothetical protein